MNFDMKRPCANCPFKTEGAIHLHPGRLKGICESIERDDTLPFLCHKTVHSKRGGEWTDSGEYRHSGNESHCMGAAAYLYKRGQTNVPTRLALMLGAITKEDLEEVAKGVIDAPSESEPNS